MRIQYILSIIIVLAVAVTVVGQDKVGSTGSNYLNLSPSVRANGMAGAGVALADIATPYFNPASTGFVDDINLLRLSFLPYRAEVLPIPNVPGLGYVALSAKILSANPENGKNLSLGAALYRTNLSLGTYVETTYDYPDGTGRYFDVSLTSTNLSVGASLDWSVDIGVGVTARWIEEKIFQLDEDFYLFDFGFILRKPVASGDWQISPSVGASWSNYGSDIEYGAGVVIDSVRPATSDNSFEPPKTRRIGAACPVAVVNSEKYGGWETFTMTPAWELEDLLVPDRSRSRLGVEVSVYEAFTLRAGTVSTGYPSSPPLDPGFELPRDPLPVNPDKSYNATTWGFSVSSRGIARLFGHLSGSEGNFLQDRFDISFSFASSPDIDNLWWTDESQSYYGISISY